jgi:hypothetical protein
LGGSFSRKMLKIRDMRDIRDKRDTKDKRDTRDSCEFSVISNLLMMSFLSLF